MRKETEKKNIKNETGSEKRTKICKKKCDNQEKQERVRKMIKEKQCMKVSREYRLKKKNKVIMELYEEISHEQERRTAYEETGEKEKL